MSKSSINTQWKIGRLAKGLASPLAFAAVLALQSNPSAAGAWNFNELSAAQGNLQVQTGALGRYMAGFAWNGQQTEHVFFIGTDNHVHELYHDKTWHHSDLTLASSDKGTPAGDLTAYVSERDGTEHVFYVGNDFPQHIHEIYYEKGKWYAHDLNAAVPDAPIPVTGSGLTGFVFESQNTQHLFYKSNFSIHELYYDGKWHHNDLGQSAGAKGNFGSFTSFAAEYEGSEHVFTDSYAGSNTLAVWEFYWLGSWKDTYISGNFPGNNPPPPNPAGQLVGYAWNETKSEHVFYIDAANAHVHELYRDQSANSWKNNDLSSGLIGRAWLPGWDGNPHATALAAFVLASEGTQHVYYLGVNNDIWELYWDGSQWQVGGKTQFNIPESLTDQFGPSLDFGGVNGGTPLIAFGTEFDKSEHVFFLSGRGKICEVYHTP
jgi:hypothetical protein